MRRIFAALAVFLALSSALRAESVTVFAAASLRSVLDEIKPRYVAATGDDLTLVYAGSSVLARQIGQGAPADVFISANSAWMDVLEGQSRLKPDTRVNLFSNSLVLISPAPSAEIALEAQSFKGARLAMGLVRAVPVGIYGREALEHLGLWAALEPQVVQTDNARAALALVARGEARFGIVYRSDALAEPRVEIVANIPQEAHSEITYPMALMSGANEAAARFASFLQSNEATQSFQAAGFTALKKAAP